MKWYKNGEMYRFHQRVGKQYTFSKGSTYDIEGWQAISCKSEKASLKWPTIPYSINISQQKF